MKYHTSILWSQIPKTKILPSFPHRQIPSPRLPLHLAAWTGDAAAIEHLLKVGFSGVHQDNNGLCALHVAAVRGMNIILF